MLAKRKIDVILEIVIYKNNLWIFTYFSIEILGLFRWNVVICMDTCLKTIPFYNHIEVSETFQTNAKIKSSTERGLQYFFLYNSYSKHTYFMSNPATCSACLMPGSGFFVVDISRIVDHHCLRTLSVLNISNDIFWQIWKHFFY